jgi:hypothetical protein
MVAAPVALLLVVAVAGGPLDPYYQAIGGPFDLRGLGGVLLVANQGALAVTTLAVVVAAGSLVGRFRRKSGVQDPPDDHGLAIPWPPSQCDGGASAPGRRRGQFEHGGGGQGRCCYRLSWLIPLPRTRGPLQAVVTAVRPDGAKYHNKGVTRITDNRLEESKNPE